MDLINLLAGDKSALLTSGFVDDFEYLSEQEAGSEGRWNITKDSAASITVDVDGLDGRATFLTTAVDNEEAYLYTNEIAQFLDGKPMLALARIQYAEGATDALNVIFGLVETVAADLLQNDAAGPKADYDGACFFKVDGGTRWQFETSDGTAQDTTDLNVTAGGSSFQTLAIEINPISSTEMLVTPWIDTSGGNNLVQPAEFGVSSRAPLVQHRETYAGAGNMAFVIGVKNGSATVETLHVDLAIFRKKR